MNFLFGIFFLAAFMYVEARVAEAPLLPAIILEVIYIGPTLFCIHRPH